jgi:hypothetical protein
MKNDDDDDAEPGVRLNVESLVPGISSYSWRPSHKIHIIMGTDACTRRDFFLYNSVLARNLQLFMIEIASKYCVGCMRRRWRGGIWQAI